MQYHSDSKLIANKNTKSKLFFNLQTLCDRPPDVHIPEICKF